MNKIIMKYPSETNEIILEFYKLINIYIKDSVKDINILHDIISLRDLIENKLMLEYDKNKYMNIFKHNVDTFDKWCETIDNHYIDQINSLNLEKDILNNIINNNHNILKSMFNKKNLIIDQERIPSNLFLNIFDILDDEHFKKFLKNEIEKGHVLFMKSEIKMFPNGISHFNISDSFNFYLVENNIQHSYMSAIIIVHELTHSYIYRKYGVDDEIYHEVAPYYNEFKFMQKLENNNLGIKDSIINYYSILSSLNLIKKGINKINNTDDIENYKYLLGILVSFELFEMYLKDNEMGDYYFKNLIKNLSDFDIINQLKNSNIDIERIESGETTKSLVKKYNSLNEYHCKKIRKLEK